MNKVIFVGIVIVGLTLVNMQQAYNSSGNPPNSNTSAPGDGSCGGCHGGNNNPNNIGGFLQFNFNNNNQSYLLSQTYTITVTNSGTNGANTRRGFQATVLNSSNSFVGTFAENSASVAIANANGRSYVEHVSASSSVSSWTFEWTAPNTNVGDVTFYVASITGNGSGSSGDILYVDTFIIRAPIAVPAPVADFTVNDNAVCRSESVTFTSTSTGNIATLNWNFGLDASPSTAIGTGPHTVSYSSSGNKTISLTASGSGGNDTETKTNFITINSLPNANAGNDVSICLGKSTTLNASGGTNYQWNNSNTLSATNIDNPTASPTVNTTYTVTVTDANGCTASDNVLVTVNNLPNADASDDVTICLGGTTELFASGGTIYQWSNAASLDNANVANPFANPTVTTSYTVTVTDNNGCSATDNVSVIVANSLIVSITNDTSICEGNPITLLASGGNSFSWSPANSLNNSNIANPVASPTITTSYTVNISDGVCNDTARVLISVDETFTANVSNDTFASINGAPVEIPLFASGGDSYTWSPATGLSDANISNPIFNTSAFASLPNISDTVISYTVIITKGACIEVDTVNIALTITISLSETFNENNIKVYPNPTKDFIFIEMGTFQDNYELLDAYGKRILVQSINETSMNLSGFPNGLYFIKLNNNNQSVFRKVVKY